MVFTGWTMSMFLTSIATIGKKWRRVNSNQGQDADTQLISLRVNFTFSVETIANSVLMIFGCYQLVFRYQNHKCPRISSACSKVKISQTSLSLLAIQKWKHTNVYSHLEVTFLKTCSASVWEKLRNLWLVFKILTFLHLRNC